MTKSKTKGHRRVLTADFGFIPTTKKTIEAKDFKGFKKTLQSPFVLPKQKRTSKGLFYNQKLSHAKLDFEQIKGIRQITSE